MFSSFANSRAARSGRQSRSYVKMSPEDWVQHIASTPQEPVTDEDMSLHGSFIEDDVEEEEEEEEDVVPDANVQEEIPRLEVPVTSAEVQPTESIEAVTASTTDLYQDIPNFLEIRKTKETGRSMWSKVPIKAGTTIISLRPRVHVLSSSHLELYCSSCCASGPSTGLKRCPKCKVVWYCGSSCQTADWSIHKIECDTLQHWAASAPPSDDDSTSVAIPSEAVRCLGRIVWMRRKEGSSSAWYKEVEAMQSHRDSLPASATDSHIHLAHFLVRYLGVDGPAELAKYNLHGIGELVDLISKFTTNTFTLTTPSLSPIGISVSPLAALINHSCDPNAAIVFPRSTVSSKLKISNGKVLREPILRVVALQDIPAESEILTSYIDVTLPTTERRKALKETYNFICECHVCVPLDSTAVSQDRRETLWCPKSCGGLCPVPSTSDSVSRCFKCKAPIHDNDSIIDAARVGQEALDKATSLQVIDPTQALKLTRNIIPILVSHNFTPSTHPLLALYRLQQSLLISSFPTDATPGKDILDETIRTAAKSFAGLSEILREGHPIRAVALAELGKLLAVDEPPISPESSSVLPSRLSQSQFPPSGEARLKLAKQTFERAMLEMRIAFGREDDGGQTGKEVRGMLVDIEKELGVWKRGLRDAMSDAIAASGGKKAVMGNTL